MLTLRRRHEYILYPYIPIKFKHSVNYFIVLELRVTIILRRTERGQVFLYVGDTYMNIFVFKNYLLNSYNLCICVCYTSVKNFKNPVTLSFCCYTFFLPHILVMMTKQHVNIYVEWTMAGCCINRSLNRNLFNF